MELIQTVKKQILLLMILLLAALIFSGCSMKKIGKEENTSAYQVTDSFGNEVTIPHKPRRILGTSSSINTMLLGVVEADRLVACFSADKDPAISYVAEETKDIALTIPLNGISMEVLTKAAPDLIIASSYTQPAELTMWRNLGYPVIMIDGPTSIEQVKGDIRIISAAAGEKERGEKVIARMDSHLAEIDTVLEKRTDPQPKALLVSQMTSYGGPGSMYHELLTRARVRNAIAEVGVSNKQLLARELIVKSDPDFFIVSSDRPSDETGAGRFRNEFFANPAIQNMRAYGNIQVLNDRYIYAASQNCVYAIKAMANAAYGPIFDMKDEKQIQGY